MAATIPATPLLRFALGGDAVASAAAGLLMAGGARLLAPYLGLPQQLLLGAGLVLLPYAAWVAWLGSQRAPSSIAVRAVIAINILWVIDSVVLAASGWVQPTALGIAFIGAQAMAVAAFAALQAMALRRAGAGRPALA